MFPLCMYIAWFGYHVIVALYVRECWLCLCRPLQNCWWFGVLVYQLSLLPTVVYSCDPSISSGQGDLSVGITYSHALGLILWAQERNWWVMRSYNISWDPSHMTYVQHNIHLNRTKHEYAKKCLRYDLPKVINDTWTAILDIINTHCLKGFATYIKHCIFQSYQETCTIVNCYICNRN